MPLAKHAPPSESAAANTAERSSPAAQPSVAQVEPYQIHSIEYGSGDTGLLLIHGLSGSGRWWRRNIDAFAEHYRVLVPDVIGFGRTRCPGRLPSIGEIAAVLAEWIRRTNLPRVHVVGHSMGGQISIHLAARFPEVVHRLVLVDAAGIPRPLAPGALTRFAMGVVPPGRWGDPLFFPVIIGDALSAGPRTILQAIAHILRDDVRPLLPRIQAPTLVVWGERDTLVPLEHAREFRDRIPDAQLAILRRAAHNPMVDRPRAFNRLVMRFLHGE